MGTAIIFLMLFAAMASGILPFIFALSGGTRMYRLGRIWLTFVTAALIYLLLVWLWSHTPEPNDAMENLAVGEELILLGGIIASIVAVTRKK
jgi:hypothetical protein